MRGEKNYSSKVGLRKNFLAEILKKTLSGGMQTCKEL
jgi:hypothetical protein